MGTAIDKPRAQEGAIVTPPAARRKFLEAFAGRLGQLTPEQQTAFLMALGEHIGVRAELGEVIIYQDKPYVTIDGRYRQAHHTGLLAGLEVRPASQTERRNYGCRDDVALWVSGAWRRGSERPFLGWGEGGGPTDKNPISKTAPAKMAKKRARYDALRAAFPVGEEIMPMHREYIEDAERSALHHRALNNPVVAATYEEPPDEIADEAGHDAAALAEPMPGGAAPPKKPGATASEAQIARILELVDHPVHSAAREAWHERLRKPVLATVAQTWIVALEAMTTHPKDDGPSTGGPSTGTSELALGDQRRTSDAVRDGGM